MESILRQKSREGWLWKEDRNSKFFFASIVMRRQRNRIWTIKDRVDWCTDHKWIQDYLVRKLKDLYTLEEIEPCRDLQHLFVHCMTTTENASIVCTLFEDEIRRAVWELHPLKSPGPNNFLEIFFKCY